MRTLFSILLISMTVFLGSNPSSQPVQDPENETPAIVHQKIKGVEVRLNQVQLQRLGAKASLAKVFRGTNLKSENFHRTIAISLSQKGQGTTIGPTFLQLKNGKQLTPFINGNQKLMSGVANANVPEGFDFAEYWFQVPEDAKLADIFPVTLFHQVTNRGEEKLSFRLQGIEP